MGYKVVGAAAVVELDDDQPDELNTGRKVYLEEGASLPDGVKEKSIEHLLSVGLIEETDDSDKPRRARAAAKDDGDS